MKVVVLDTASDGVVALTVMVLLMNDWVPAAAEMTPVPASMLMPVGGVPVRDHVMAPVPDPAVLVAVAITTLPVVPG